MITTEQATILKQKFPAGTRVQLVKMNDPYHPVPSGTTGTVKYVDDAGTVHVSWDNGSGLGLIVGEDLFNIIPPKEES